MTVLRSDSNNNLLTVVGDVFNCEHSENASSVVSSSLLLKSYFSV